MKKVALFMGISLVVLLSTAPIRLVNLYLSLGTALAAGATVFLLAESSRGRRLDALQALVAGTLVGMAGAAVAFSLDGLLALAGTRFTFDPMPAANYLFYGGLLDAVLNLGRDGAPSVTSGVVGHVLIGVMGSGLAGALGGLMAGMHVDSAAPTEAPRRPRTQPTPPWFSPFES